MNINIIEIVCLHINDMIYVCMQGRFIHAYCISKIFTNQCKVRPVLHFSFSSLGAGQVQSNDSQCVLFYKVDIGHTRWISDRNRNINKQALVKYKYSKDFAQSQFLPRFP